MDDVRKFNYKKTTEAVHMNAHSQECGLPKRIIDTTLMQTALRPFFDTLFERGMNVHFAGSNLAQHSGVQLAFRPAGWDNTTDKGGYMGHVDKLGCGFSCLVGVCLYDPIDTNLQ